MVDRYIVLSNGEKWCLHSWKNYVDTHDIEFYQLPMKWNSFSRKICLKHLFSPRIPFKWIWYPFLDKAFRFSKSQKVYMFVYDHNPLVFEQHYFQRIRNKYPNFKIIFLFSNIVKLSGVAQRGIIDKLNQQYDLVYAFDKLDATQYGFRYNPLIYTAKLPNKISNLPETDIFYLGQAKDRYSLLIEIYESAKRLGLICDFNIFGVPEEKQLYKDEITYNKYMEYEEALSRMSKTKCLVDAIQGDSTGLTIKTCEAVMFNKKLITTNIHVREEEFYSANNILVFPEENLSLDFVRSDCSYPEGSGKCFLPETLFSKVDSALSTSQN